MPVDLNKRFYMEVVSVPAHVLEGKKLGPIERARALAGNIPGVKSGLDTVEFIRVQTPGQQGYEWYQYQTHPDGAPFNLTQVNTPAVDSKDVRILAGGEVNPSTDYTAHPSQHPLLSAWKNNRQTLEARHVNLAAEQDFLPVPAQVKQRTGWVDAIGNAMWAALNAEDAQIAHAARTERRQAANQTLADSSVKAEQMAREQMNAFGKFVGGGVSLAAGVGILEVANRFAEPVIDLVVKDKEKTGAIGNLVNLGTRVLQGATVLAYGLATLNKVLGENTSLRNIAEGGLKGINRLAINTGETFNDAKS
ncbi:hypothetical protein GC177_04460, partial [bacterium]|nr:hypothetical protein [bacterium]